MKDSPYFEEVSGETINEYLYKILEKLNDEALDISSVGSEVNNLDLLPDGAFKINSVDDTGLSYNIQVNDNKYIQMHKNNGITRIGIVNPKNGQII